MKVLLIVFIKGIVFMLIEFKANLEWTEPKLYKYQTHVFVIALYYSW